MHGCTGYEIWRRSQNRAAGTCWTGHLERAGKASERVKSGIVVKAAKRSAEVPIYQIKATLEGSKPPIWRRLLVHSDITLGDLHTIIQASWAGGIVACIRVQGDLNSNARRECYPGLGDVGIGDH